MTPTAIPDPYDPQPSVWQRHADTFGAAAAGLLTVILTVVAFPPSQGPEFGYAFAAPAIFWAFLRPPFRLFAGTMLVAQAVAWTTLLFWLHHVTWLGLALLGPFVGAWVGVWYLAVWWTMPRLLGRPVLVRLAAQCGLAGLWVVIEWSRTWLLGGFAWLPLAASQWQRTSILQIASYTGAGGVSFVLIVMNVGFAAYGHRLLREGRSGLARRSQEFMLALFLLLACLSVFFVEVRPFERAAVLPLGRVAFVQPDIPQEIKWDPAKGPGNFQVLERLTLAAAASRPDLILWPESVTWLPVTSSAEARDAVVSVAARAHAPILFGSDAVEGLGTAQERDYNAAFVVTPDFGLQPAFYAKRKLVPFGEYLPLHALLGWLSKIVPVGPDSGYAAGTEAAPLVVGLPSGSAAIGVLICFEDTYPQLARHTVLEGADELTDLTNDGWFGEEGEAYQHAAHSVLRAVETRRLVLRCGNAGWSGWIDEFGGIRYTLLNKAGSVYFRGSQAKDITRDARWVGRDSFYVEHGDWFVVVAAVLAIFGYAAIATSRPEAVERP